VGGQMGDEAAQGVVDGGATDHVVVVEDEHARRRRARQVVQQEGKDRRGEVVLAPWAAQQG